MLAYVADGESADDMRASFDALADEDVQATIAFEATRSAASNISPNLSRLATIRVDISRLTACFGTAENQGLFRVFRVISTS